jgi:CMP-N-acetylneuraminic acid synthetase
MQQVTAYYPVRKHSERVPGKNLRLFNGRPLFTVVLHTLLETECIREIIVDTDAPEISAYARSLPRCRVAEREKSLRGTSVTMNTLIADMLKKQPGEHFLQTHATNPLLRRETIRECVDSYFNGLPENDSLFSVTAYQKRFYHADGRPVNHFPGRMEQTQEMEPLFGENSALFIFSRSSFAAAGNNRIGNSPRLFSMSQAEGIDIDTEEDFRLAGLLAEHWRF